MTMRIATQPSPPQASVFRAALWMGGWLALMLTMAVAGRETASRLDAPPSRGPPFSPLPRLSRCRLRGPVPKKACARPRMSWR